MQIFSTNIMQRTKIIKYNVRFLVLFPLRSQMPEDIQ
jgi:hypothetical protein